MVSETCYAAQCQSCVPVLVCFSVSCAPHDAGRYEVKPTSRCTPKSSADSCNHPHPKPKKGIWGGKGCQLQPLSLRTVLALAPIQSREIALTPDQSWEMALALDQSQEMALVIGLQP